MKALLDMKQDISNRCKPFSAPLHSNAHMSISHDTILGQVRYLIVCRHVCLALLTGDSSSLWTVETAADDPRMNHIFLLLGTVHELVANASCHVTHSSTSLSYIGNLMHTRSLSQLWEAAHTDHQSRCYSVTGVAAIIETLESCGKEPPFGGLRRCEERDIQIRQSAI